MTVPLVFATDAKGCIFSNDAACVVMSEENAERSAPVRRAVAIEDQA